MLSRVILLIAADTAASIPPWTAISGFTVGLVAGAVAVWSARFSDRAQQRDRRRTRAAEAYKAALAWNEMLYRIRRRSDDPEQRTSLVDRFHLLQEEIAFYRGWLTAEEPALGRSYDRLVCHVKKETEELIRQAWRCPGHQPEDELPAEQKLPDIRQECDRFLTDVRDHLSPLPWCRWQVRRRNPQETTK